LKATAKNKAELFFKGYDQQSAGSFQAWQFFRVLQKVKKLSASITSFIDRSFLSKKVRTFFDLKPAPSYRKSRIRRRTNKSFEDFIFKGYDQQTPGLSRPGTFKDISRIYKN
jgi:hypothetical protein